jgi:hypothetical protein
MRLFKYMPWTVYKNYLIELVFNVAYKRLPRKNWVGINKWCWWRENEAKKLRIIKIPRILMRMSFILQILNLSLGQLSMWMEWYESIME